MVTVTNTSELKDAIADNVGYIDLADGIYESIVIPRYYTGVIKAHNPWGAKIFGGDDCIRFEDGCHDVSLDGIHVFCARYCGIRLQGTNRIKVRNCRAELCRSQGVLGDGEGHTIQGCLLQRSGLTKWDHGLYLTGDRCSVVGNVARGNFGWGLHLYPKLTNSRVIYNQAYDNKFVGMTLWSGGGNVVMGNHSWGNGRENFAWKATEANTIANNWEVDPKSWELATVPEKTGGWKVPVTSVDTYQPN